MEQLCCHFLVTRVGNYVECFQSIATRIAL